MPSTKEPYQWPGVSDRLPLARIGLAPAHGLRHQLHHVGTVAKTDREAFAGGPEKREGIAAMVEHPGRVVREAMRQTLQTGVNV